VDRALIDWLASPAGREAILQAGTTLDRLGRDPQAHLLAAEQLRSPQGGLDPTQAAAALTQADLARRAELTPGTWLLTRDGLEQATHPQVAARHAQHLRQIAPAVVDLGAGLGFDAAAMVAAGLTVTAVERDPERAALLQANVPRAQVIVGDATNPQTLQQAWGSGGAVIFCDPGRRGGARQIDGRRAHPERDPERWSPPWSFVLALAAHHPVCAKVAAGIPRNQIPSGWQGEWVSREGHLVEAFLTNQPALGADRQAAVLRSNHWQVITRSSTAAITPSAQVLPYVHEVDEAVIAADTAATLAEQLGAGALSTDARWLTTASMVPTKFAHFLRSYLVLDELPARTTDLRSALRERGITRATIKQRGRDMSKLRHELALPEGSESMLAFIGEVRSDQERVLLLKLC